MSSIKQTLAAIALAIAVISPAAADGIDADVTRTYSRILRECNFPETLRPVVMQSIGPVSDAAIVAEFPDQGLDELLLTPEAQARWVSTINRTFDGTDRLQTRAQLCGVIAKALR